jgi:hypothetical protein
MPRTRTVYCRKYKIAFEIPGTLRLGLGRNCYKLSIKYTAFNIYIIQINF